MWRTELSLELAHELVNACLSGITKRQAALLCGVLPERLEEWLARGAHEDAQEPFRTFACLWFKAEAELAQEAEEARTRGRYKDPKIATQFLVDRFPDEYGPKAKTSKDPIAEAMARPGKKEQVRKFIRKQDPEFFQILLEEGALEALAALRARAPPSDEASDPTLALVASEPRHPIGG